MVVSDSELRARLEAEWCRIDTAAVARKDSQSAVSQLAVLYSSLAASERVIADDVLREWALSDNSKRRFDALALIDKFSITSALPALRTLAARFESADGPSAPYDWAKVNRLIGRLATENDAP